MTPRLTYALVHGELGPDHRCAQVLSLIEGPLRIAGIDFPDRQWMLDLAERNITTALNAV